MTLIEDRFFNGTINLADKGMPVLQMERKILEINDLVAQYTEHIFS